MVAWLSHHWTRTSSCAAIRLPSISLLTQRGFHSGICAPGSNKVTKTSTTSITSCKNFGTKQKSSGILLSIFFNIMWKWRHYTEVLDEVLPDSWQWFWSWYRWQEWLKHSEISSSSCSGGVVNDNRSSISASECMYRKTSETVAALRPLPHINCWKNRTATQQSVAEDSDTETRQWLCHTARWRWHWQFPASTTTKCVGHW